MTQKFAIALILVLLNLVGTVACQTFYTETGANRKPAKAPTISEVFQGRMNN